MLNLNDIKEYFPEKARSFTKSMLTEYLHYKILNILFNSKINHKLIFIGGTALRIIHNTERFSEDLDFDNFNLTYKEFYTLSETVQKELSLEGYSLNIEPSKNKKTFHYNIKIPKLLFDTNISSHINENLIVKVDTEPHYFKYNPEIALINKFGVFTQIKVAPKDILLSQKIRAIFNRKRAKGRDFYDVIFLLAKTKPNYDYLKFTLKIKTPSELKEKLVTKCASLNFTDLKKDIHPFLFNPQDIKMVTHFNEYIKNYSF